MRKVVIVGRPNVGKSSLYNRLLGRRDAVVADEAGVTRDLKEAVVEGENGKFKLVDTGGLWSGDAWEPKIREKVDRALEEADLILFLVDGRAELAQADYEVADYLRRKNKPVLLVATKVDHPNHEAYLGELYALGFGDPLPTSVEHRRGLDELEEAIWKALPDEESETEVEVPPVRIAIIGRPNAGKSSLLNAILGEERVIVSDQPGTTRDSIDVELDYGGTRFVLVDTAGIRKRPETAVEHFAIQRAHRVIKEADVVVLAVDPFELGDRELKMAGEALDAGKPVILAVTKWDAVPKEERREVRRRIREKLAHLEHLPIIYTSAVSGQNIPRIFQEAVRLYEKARTRYDTGELNRWAQLWLTKTRVPIFRGKPLKIFYVTQPEVAPPLFVFFVNQPDFVTRAFENYIKNRIREDLDLREIPFKLAWRGRKGRG
ncbi:ribosome biogenesis GTPase Der [Oceanithermus sp.]